MEYIFGSDLKTVGDVHTDLKGHQLTQRTYDDTVITDTFDVVKKYHSAEDSEGNCYDWYYITNHTQKIDFSPKKTEESQAKDTKIQELLVLLLEGGSVNDVL